MNVENTNLDENKQNHKSNDESSDTNSELSKSEESSNSKTNKNKKRDRKRKVWDSWSREEKVLFYEAIANGSSGARSLQNLFKTMNEVSYLY